MDRSKKSEKNSVKKKNGTTDDDMEAEIPKKKLPLKKKDKNWKNHLLDNDEEDDIDISSLEGLDAFESHADDDDDDL